MFKALRAFLRDAALLPAAAVSGAQAQSRYRLKMPQPMGISCRGTTSMEVALPLAGFTQDNVFRF